VRGFGLRIAYRSRLLPSRMARLVEVSGEEPFMRYRDAVVSRPGYGSGRIFMFPAASPALIGTRRV
jgi:hypothetical protein